MMWGAVEFVTRALLLLPFVVFFALFVSMARDNTRAGYCGACGSPSAYRYCLDCACAYCSPSVRGWFTPIGGGQGVPLCDKCADRFAVCSDCERVLVGSAVTCSDCRGA